MNQEILQLCKEVTSLTATVTTTACTSPNMEERLATIQIAIEETSRWVDIVKKSPKVIVSATIVEQQQRASKALNIRVRGIPRTDSTPLADATTFVTSTLGIAAHGIEHAWRTGRDLTRSQPLLI